MITIIAALSENNVIGKDGGIPWKISDDVIRFKELTSGHTVVMGRKTYESLSPHVRPLPNRNNIVLTSQFDYQETGIKICSGTGVLVDAIFPIYPNIFICGGVSLYNFCIPFADKLELTFVDGEYNGDTYFPFFERTGNTLFFPPETEGGILSGHRFSLINHKQHDGYSFQTFERV